MRKRIVALVFLFFYIFSHGVGAVGQSALNGLVNGRAWYDPNQETSCAAGVLPSTGEGGTEENTYVNWQSGLEPPYIMEQYIIEVLKYIADFKDADRDNVVTKEHTLALLAWAWGEGGDINNRSTFNLFNSGALRDDPEARPYAAGGVDGRQAYASFDIGIKATGGNILGGASGQPNRYSRVVDAVLNKDTSAEDVLYAYAHYSKYPGNSWWAEQNKIDGEDAYYNKMISQLNGMRSNYQSRAATIIGTPDREQQTGARDSTKLFYKHDEDTSTGGTTGGDPAAISGSEACADAPISGGTIVEIAEREFAAGANETDNSYHKYTTGRSEAWCAWFVSWVYQDAGQPFTGGSAGGWAYPSVAGMLTLARSNNWFHSKADAISGDFVPQPGDVAIYKEGVGSYPSHVNIVISYDQSKKEYIAIGGNEGDSIRKRTHSLSSNSLTGFLRKGASSDTQPEL